MARYKYLGQPLYPNAGPCTIIRLKKTDGTTDTLLPISPATTFPVDVDLGYDITDPRSVQQLDLDPRFALIP